MEFKAGDRVRVLRFNGEDVDFYGTLKYVDKCMANLFDCTIKRNEGVAVFLPSNNSFGEDKEDYYVLAEDEEDKRTVNDLNVNAYETKLVTEDEEDTEEPVIQHTDTLDNGEIIAQSIVDNRDGASFISAHEMIVFLNEVEEMHGETISVKGWNLIFDYIKASITPAYFGRD